MRRTTMAVGMAALLLSAGMAVAKIRPGDPAPHFRVRTFDKVDVDSDTLRGQVVIINRWATWCGPCKKELPELDAYYRVHARQGLRIFAVTTEDSVPQYLLRPLSAVLAFPLAQSIKGSGFPELGGVPTNYVIDRHGIVRYAQAGAFDAATLDEVVGPLLAEASGPAPQQTAAR